MRHVRAFGYTLCLALIATFAVPGGRIHAQGTAADPNAAPNPYKEDTGWAKLQNGRRWGAVSAVEIDRDAKSVWTFDRCETANDCSASNLDPIQKFDAAGNLVLSFGKGMFNYPHGIFIDAEDNIWVTDGHAKNGKGHTVLKFNNQGKLLMTLGTPGIPGNDETHFNTPSDVLVAPNGDIFVADGHGGNTNARIVKFDKTGKFMKAWGKKGSAPGEFDAPHGVAMDSVGRLYVADRSNNRIQIFDQDGKFIAEWRQFGRPSGVYIDQNDIIYVAGASSDNVHSGPGIRIGSVKDGVVKEFIPWNEDNTLEGVALDAAGNVYGGFTNTLNFRRFVKK
jgi:DNA-binding beta-propeller fold protein YncE